MTELTRIEMQLPNGRWAKVGYGERERGFLSQEFYYQQALHPQSKLRERVINTINETLWP